MSGDAKAFVVTVALLALVGCTIAITTAWYYHGKDERQGARGKANVDIVCTVKTPPSKA